MSTVRWRKLECRLWQDETFCKLSPIPPCGRGLFLMLLTGPHTGPIPGLSRVGRAALSEQFEWAIEAFDKAFEEAFALGLVEADWKARLVWIPSAIAANPPQSPNVITSWTSEWSVIPDCELKQKAYAALKSVCCECGEPYAEAFAKAIAKPIAKPSRKTLPNQEKEQVVGVAVEEVSSVGEREMECEEEGGNGACNGHVTPTIAESSKPSLEVKTKKIKTKLPKTFRPKAEHYALAKELGLACEPQCISFIRFINTERSEATYEDWDEVFCAWLEKIAGHNVAS